jgi:hypothetical protein
MRPSAARRTTSEETNFTVHLGDVHCVCPGHVCPGHVCPGHVCQATLPRPPPISLDRRLSSASKLNAFAVHSSQAAAVWCGRGDSNPHRHCCPTDFLTSYGFHRPRLPAVQGGGFVVWTIPSPCSGREKARRRVGAARLVSTPSHRDGPRPPRRAWLGIARNKVSPSLGSSASGVSPGALKLHPKSVASTAFATPA